MKTSLPLAIVASLACALFFTNCTKEKVNPADSVAAQNSSDATAGEDRINAIVKDLSTDSYSLNFNKTYTKYGITQLNYGTDSYLDFADPGDLKCGTPIRIRFKRIPIWRNPKIVWPPTCPDMVIDINRLTEIQKLLMTADPKKYSDLQQIKFVNTEGGFLASKRYMNQFPKMKLDKIDDATADLSPEKFLMLNDPQNLGSGATRSFYGYADLNEIVFRPYKKSLKDILKPTLKGCFDPEILKALTERLQKIDPSFYNSLVVNYLPENKNIGILSFKQ